LSNEAAAIIRARIPHYRIGVRSEHEAARYRLSAMNRSSTGGGKEHHFLDFKPPAQLAQVKDDDSTMCRSVNIMAQHAPKKCQAFAATVSISTTHLGFASSLTTTQVEAGVCPGFRYFSR
jgi:hypothetical protein